LLFKNNTENNIKKNNNINDRPYTPDLVQNTPHQINLFMHHI